MLSSIDQNKIRQTQVERDEVVQILGQHEEFYLLKKWDEVLGWIHIQSVNMRHDLSKFSPPKSKNISTSDFFTYWKGTPYKWGGITELGIDCSGFTQRYYLDVLNFNLPKNSKDQRRLGESILMSEIKENDLIFCHRKGGTGIHHVGLFFGGNVLHAQLKLGVISETLEDFIEAHVIEDVVRILNRHESERESILRE